MRRTVAPGVLPCACDGRHAGGGGGQAQPATTGTGNGCLDVTARTVLWGARPDGAHRCRRAHDQPPPRRPLRATPSRHHRRTSLHLTGGGSRFGRPYEPADGLVTWTPLAALRAGGSRG